MKYYPIIFFCSNVLKFIQWNGIILHMTNSLNKEARFFKPKKLASVIQMFLLDLKFI